MFQNLLKIRQVEFNHHENKTIGTVADRQRSDFQVGRSLVGCHFPAALPGYPCKTSGGCVILITGRSSKPSKVLLFSPAVLFIFYKNSFSQSYTITTHIAVYTLFQERETVP